MLTRDVFGILISVVCSNSVALDHLTIYRIVGVLHFLGLVQSFMTIFENEFESAFEIGDLEEILKLFCVERNDEDLEDSLRRRSVKFMKQASLLLMLLDNRITENISLGLTLDRDSSPFNKDYEQLCCLLRVPTSTLEILRSPTSIKLLTKWIRIRNDRRKANKTEKNSEKSDGDEKMEEKSEDEKMEENKVEKNVVCRRIFPSGEFTFVKLPELFQEVYQHLVRQYCDVCEELSPEIGICLSCGEVICAGIKHLLGRTDNLQIPNSLNVFVEHAENCCGVFLVLKLSTMLLFRGKRVSVWNSIYLDEHGEEDIELKRGKALYLDDSRVSQLLQLVLTQKLDHDTRILRKTQLLGLPDTM
mmetsp:Transcript_87625/g.131406  ORF Transcript_87625/g.131406 Transcript_87625/m.131406 type:complete len:360 (-) Transcript_87625:35-1114(-)